MTKKCNQPQYKFSGFFTMNCMKGDEFGKGANGIVYEK